MHLVRLIIDFSFIIDFLYLVSGAGYPGRYTKTRGYLSYYEVKIFRFFFECIYELFDIRYVKSNILKVGKKYG